MYIYVHYMTYDNTPIAHAHELMKINKLMIYGNCVINPLATKEKMLRLCSAKG